MDPLEKEDVSDHSFLTHVHNTLCWNFPNLENVVAVATTVVVIVDVVNMVIVFIVVVIRELV